MKLDLAARREELLRERAKIEEQIATLQKEHDQIDARLNEIEKIVTALGPDFSGRAPIAGGPIEPNRRRPRLDYRALTLEQVRNRPGQTPAQITEEIARLTIDPTDHKPRVIHLARVLNALAYWEPKGDVKPDRHGTWWPMILMDTFSEGPQDTE